MRLIVTLMALVGLMTMQSVHLIVPSRLPLAIGLAGGQEAPIPVVATFSILGDLVANVAGSRVSLTTLVGPGTDAHEFQPTPSDAAAVSQAHLLFSNGLGFETWLDGVITNAANQSLMHIVLSDGLPVLGRAGADQGSGESNPHLWLDVRRAIAYVQVIRDVFKTIDPGHTDLYDANAARYLMLLWDLDNAIELEVQKVPIDRLKLMTFHDAWPYFCERYGLQCIAVMQSSPDGEPSAQEYAELVDLIAREKIKVIFGEAGFNPRLIRQLARDTGIDFVDQLHGDTLASEGLPATYVGMMQYDISLITSMLARQ